MKHIIAITFCLFTINTFGQVLTFKSAETSRRGDYQEFAKQFLGKTVTVKVFDNSISVQLQGDRNLIYLTKTSVANQYSASIDEGSYHALTTIQLNYTVGVISSLEIEMDKLDNRGMIESYKKAIAKRF